jgi:ABC-type sulfate transport system substrate-binding protein
MSLTARHHLQLKSRRFALVLAASAATLLAPAAWAQKQVSLLNASDPTRELYQEYNKASPGGRIGEIVTIMPWRIGQQALGDRRAGGRCRHACTGV